MMQLIRRLCFFMILGIALMTLLSACGGSQGQRMLTVPGASPSATPVGNFLAAARPATGLPATAWEDFPIPDFGAVHLPIDGDSNAHLIFGNLQPQPPAANVSPEWTAFLGRWEGYSDAPPVQKDGKYVLVVQEISAAGGTAFLWEGTNLQFPTLVKQLHFRVAAGETPSIEVEFRDGEVRTILAFAYDRKRDLLQGWTLQPDTGGVSGAIELTRSRSFLVYKDYPAYLESKRIYSESYQDPIVAQLYGSKYLVYLPEGYEADAQKTWPLLLFLHGSGDRGENEFLLPKASPFMMIREKGPLPMIIIAPLLKASPLYRSFPEPFLDYALDRALADYRVDRSRIYLTGLSIGGEAAYRFALHRPDAFAALAPLCAYLEGADAGRMAVLRNLPVWAIHGEDDALVPLSAGRQPVDALEAAGGNVRFTVLAGHDHDVWTDMYSDPAFYEWLLAQNRP